MEATMLWMTSQSIRAANQYNVHLRVSNNVLAIWNYVISAHLKDEHMHIAIIIIITFALLTLFA